MHHYRGKLLTAPAGGHAVAVPATVNPALIDVKMGSVAIPKCRKTPFPISPSEGAGVANKQEASSKAPLAGCRERRARYLLVISSLPVLLILPSHLLRLQLYTQHLLRGSRRTADIKSEVHELFQLLYILSFVVNFIIYGLCGHRDRGWLCNR